MITSELKFQIRFIMDKELSYQKEIQRKSTSNSLQTSICKIQKTNNKTQAGILRCKRTFIINYYAVSSTKPNVQESFLWSRVKYSTSR